MSRWNHQFVSATRSMIACGVSGLILFLFVAQPLCAEEEAVESAVENTVEQPIESDSDAEDLAKAEETTEETAPAARALPWHDSLEAAIQEASAKSKPILLCFGADWCPSCRMLEEELSKPDAQAELGRWTLVRLDVDDHPAEANQLAVQVVPSLRVLTVGGQQTAVRNGYVEVKELLEWLDDKHKKASGEVAEVLLASGTLRKSEVRRLIEQVASRDTIERETAIRRLFDDPAAARERVVKALREGTLATRLATLEIVDRWKGPIDGLDPWHPDSFDDARLEQLEEWLEQPLAEPSDAEEVATLTDEQIATASEEIDQLLKAVAGDVESIRERLARFGPALLETVYARLEQATDDTALERLRALRYRLVASDALVLQWRGGIERLAMSDAATRRQAAESLLEFASDQDQPLLLELFGDADPLVRELCLRGLNQIGGRETSKALVKLLNDPEPNIRAAVLKQIAESPDKSMTPKVVAYAKQESDADLVVHAIRFLREVDSPLAFACLIELLEHPTWQVRAEAAEGVAKKLDSFYGGINPSDVQLEAITAMIQLLDDEDSFVVSRALDGLGSVDVVAAVKPMAKAAERHPTLAPKIVGILAQGNKTRKPAMPHLKQFLKHESPSVRAAAVTGLSQHVAGAVADELVAAFGDEDRSVRIAAAEGVLFLLTQMRPDDDAFGPQEASDDNPFGEPSWQGGFAVEVEPPKTITQQILGIFGIGRSSGPVAEPPDVVEIGKLEIEELDEMEEAKPAVEATEDDDEDKDEDSPPAPDEEPAKQNDAEPKESNEETNNDQEDMEADTKAEKEQNPADEDADAQASDETEPEEKEPEPEEKEPTTGEKWDEWLTKFSRGESDQERPEWPEWIEKTIAPLHAMLDSDDPKERLAAALPLIAMGNRDRASEVIAEIAADHPEHFVQATSALSWLVWEERQKLFDQLLANADGKLPRLATLVVAMSKVHDFRAAEKIWSVIDANPTSLELASAVEQGLKAIYIDESYNKITKVGNTTHYTSGKRSSRADEVRAAIRPRLAEGEPLVRLVALVLLYDADKSLVAEEAEKILTDESAPDDLARDAFQIKLSSMPNSEQRNSAAIEGLQNDRQSIRQLSIAVLAKGDDGLRIVRERFYLSYNSFGNSSYNSGEELPIRFVESPQGLEADAVRPFLDSDDAETKALAGYLLAILGEQEGLDALLAYWNSSKIGSRDAWDPLVYRAITSLNDSEHLPELREIYERLDTYEVSEFYWTIRGMSGSEVVGFRKEIRDEVGMDQLR